MPKYALGISAFHNDSAAALVKDGEIIAAAQEERFTRKKRDHSYPRNAIRYCLEEARIEKNRVDLVSSYDETISHAASAFYPSPFNKAAILIVNGPGSKTAACFGCGDGSSLKIHSKIKYPNSIGLLYSAFTEYCGFMLGHDEYKLMGLAPYGKPRYVDTILKSLIDIGPDCSLKLNLKYFNHKTSRSIANKRFNSLFGGIPRKKGARITKRFMDIARSVQVVTEMALMNMTKRLHMETGLENLCMAGEVALNCVANGRILREGPFKRVWVQPASSNAGCALGSALLGWHQKLGMRRKVDKGRDSQKMSLLGPHFSDNKIEECLKASGIKYEKLQRGVMLKKVSHLLARQKIIGWFQGRMEFGPRALGDRSILADPRSKYMRDIINSKVKFRESFRPFAPSVLLKKARDYFDIDCESPYMLFVSAVKKKGFSAITHVDNSARVQTIKRIDNPLFHDLLDQFYKDTGCPMLINTSFNKMGEPIVCTPDDACKCFKVTGMDYLSIGSFLCKKEK